MQDTYFYNLVNSVGHVILKALLLLPSDGYRAEFPRIGACTLLKATPRCLQTIGQVR